jgi:predicted MPP superfamily phosphohydrolase
MRRRFAVLLLVLVGATGWALGPEFALPNQPDSIKFAVIGDMGTGNRPQYEVAEQMKILHPKFPFDMVLMVGDNVYGAQDFVTKFERPYAPLLSAGIQFYAALGNHDDPTRDLGYKAFNMSGERHYTYARQNVRFFMLDTNALDRKQLAWVENVLQRSADPWKIAIFHHPLYSDGGRHGSDVQLRLVLEPLLVRYGVNVVFSGHDHLYERTTPQKGITYFVAGSSGKLARGDVIRSPMTAAAFDQDQAFVAVEVTGDRLFFQAISRTGAIVDSGVIRRLPTT